MKLEKLVPEFIPTKNWKQYKKDFDGCFYGVKDISNYNFWLEHHNDYEIRNEMGYSYTIGYMSNLPIVVSVGFITINKTYKVFLYEGCSLLVYYPAIENFIQTVFPYIDENCTYNSKKKGRYKITDDSNSYDVISEIKRLGQEKIANSDIFILTK